MNKAVVTHSQAMAALALLEYPFTAMLKEMSRTGVVNRDVLCVAIPIIPSIENQTGWVTKTIGSMPENEWTAQYDAIAEGKARASLEHRMNTVRLVNECPQLMTEGTVIWQGGVYVDGIVAAASGVQPWFDHMFAHMIVSAIKALIRFELEDILSGKDDFVTDDKRKDALHLLTAANV